MQKKTRSFYNWVNFLMWENPISKDKHRMRQKKAACFMKTKRDMLQSSVGLWITHSSAQQQLPHYYLNWGILKHIQWKSLIICTDHLILKRGEVKSLDAQQDPPHEHQTSWLFGTNPTSQQSFLQLWRTKSKHRLSGWKQCKMQNAKHNALCYNSIKPRWTQINQLLINPANYCSHLQGPFLGQCQMRHLPR